MSTSNYKTFQLIIYMCLWNKDKLRAHTHSIIVFLRSDWIPL